MEGRKMHIKFETSKQRRKEHSVYKQDWKRHYQNLWNDPEATVNEDEDNTTFDGRDIDNIN